MPTRQSRSHLRQLVPRHHLNHGEKGGKGEEWSVRPGLTMQEYAKQTNRTASPFRHMTAPLSAMIVATNVDSKQSGVALEESVLRCAIKDKQAPIMQ